MSELEYQILLSTFLAFGPKRLKLLERYFEKASNVWEATETDLLETGLSKGLVTKFVAHRVAFDKNRYFERLKSLEIDYIHHKDNRYPESLRGIEDLPYALYVRGNSQVLGLPGIAIVGSRKMTHYGKDVCEIFSKGLAREGLSIISGLARGIDTVSHIGALSVKGKTIAVLACGLDLVYPPENHNLARKIVELGGAIISEYPLGYEARRENFPQRNRIVSALSKGVLVIEGEKKSGTLLTARHAGEQGRTVYAVPGNVMNPMSEAPNMLIKDGAILVTEPNDILIELGYEKGKIPSIAVSELDQTERTIIEALASCPLTLDELGRITAIAVGTISAKLTVMELKNVVKHLGGGTYRRV